MAEGLLPHSSSSKKKGKQKTFDVFHQHPPRLIADRYNNNTRVLQHTSDSDSSSKSGYGSVSSGQSNGRGLLAGGAVPSSTALEAASANVPYFMGSNRVPEYSGDTTFVTASVRDPIVSVDHAASPSQNSPSNSLLPAVPNFHLRKLSADSHQNVSSANDPSSGTASPLCASSRSAFSPVVAISCNGVVPPPRVPPRVPLQQRPFGKQHKRNSASCSVSGSNVSINSAASSTAQGDVSAMMSKELGASHTLSPNSSGSTLKSTDVLTSVNSDALQAIANMHISTSQSLRTKSVSPLTCEQPNQDNSGVEMVKDMSTPMQNKNAPNIEDELSPSPSNLKMNSPLQINSTSITSAQLSRTATSSVPLSTNKRDSELNNMGSTSQPVENTGADKVRVGTVAPALQPVGAKHNAQKVNSSSSERVKISLEQQNSKQVTSERKTSNQIWTLLESGKLSQDTSRLFRSLPMLRPGDQSVANGSQMTQSLNRNNFQVLPSNNSGGGSSAANNRASSNSPDTSRLMREGGEQQISSDALMEQIYDLDKQRALLLSQIEKKSQRLKFYSQKFANLRNRMNVLTDNEALALLESDEVVLKCKMKEELSVESDKQLQKKLEQENETLKRMDEKLIQLFELFYLIENAPKTPASNSMHENQSSLEQTSLASPSKPVEVVRFAESSHKNETRDADGGSTGQTAVLRPAASSFEVAPVGQVKSVAPTTASASAPPIEMMYSFLASFNDKNYEEMSKTFFLMSSTPESCLAMRQSGCLPLLIQLIHCELDTSVSGNETPSKTATRLTNGAAVSSSSLSVENDAPVSADGIGDPAGVDAVGGGGGVATSEDSSVQQHLEGVCRTMEELNKISCSVRQRAIESLNNIVHSQSHTVQSNREIKMLSYLTRIRNYCENICSHYCQYLLMERELCGEAGVGVGLGSPPEMESHMFLNTSFHLKELDPIVNLLFTLMKLSFSAEELASFQSLGGIPAICELLLVDVGRQFIISKRQSARQPVAATLVSLSMKLRRHIAELLTNMTHKNQAAKSTLTHYPKVMRSICGQLSSKREDLVHVTADLIRNLAWQPERSQVLILRELNVVILLTEALVSFNDVMALRAILCALWNLASHCMENRVEVCSVSGSLEKIVSLLKLDLSASAQSLYENHQVVYNASGLLSNVCSHVATRTELRQVLRQMDTFEILLELAKRQDLPDIVANVCSCLFYLSSRDKQDQEILWQLGAPVILKDLSNSASTKISTAAHGARKNLMQAKSQLKSSNNVHTSSSTSCQNKIPNSAILQQNSSTPDNKGGGALPGVAKLVRPAIMYDDANQSQGFAGSSGQFLEITDPIPNNNENMVFDFQNISNSDVVSSKSLGNSQTDSGINGDIAWLKEAYQRRRENIDAQNPQRNPRLPNLKPQQTRSSNVHPNRKAGLMHARGEAQSFNSYKDEYSNRAPKDRRGVEFESRRNLMDDEKRSVTSSQGDDEVVNYTLKYSAIESQGELGMTEVDEDADFPTYPLGNSNEEPEYYEQPTDFSVRFPENDAMSTYEELDFGLAANMKRNAIGRDLESVGAIRAQQQQVCFSEVYNEHDEEQNDSMNETLQPQGVVMNSHSHSPAAVFRQVRFKSAVNETSNHLPHQSAMLESERRAAVSSSMAARGPLDSVSSSVHQEQETDGVVSKKGSATGTPLMGDTPLMFSRRSSVSSLGDFETQSINSNSNFASEQGSRAISGAVSPSDIPDSPNEAMMASRISTGQHVPEAPNRHVPVHTAGNSGAIVEQSSALAVAGEEDQDPRTFATETTPNDYSCASSLSALTFDDEPKAKTSNLFATQFTDSNYQQDQFLQMNQMHVPPRLNLKSTAGMSQDMQGTHESIVPHDWSKRPLGMNQSEQADAIEDDDSLLLDDDDDDAHLQGSNEEDHSVLMEAISSGMPERRAKPSSSRKTQNSFGNTKSSKDTANSATGGYAQAYFKGRQSPGLTRSNSGRSLNSSGGRKSPGPKVVGGSTYSSNRPQNTYMDLYMRRTSQTESGISSPRGGTGNMDTVKTYQTEGTPLNFSTRTSLSDLSVVDDGIPSADVYLAPDQTYTAAAPPGKHQGQALEVPGKGSRVRTWAINSPGVASVGKYSNAMGGFDSPKVYNIEGTPASYSRNDSLSSLSCDEYMDETVSKSHKMPSSESQQKRRQNASSSKTVSKIPVSKSISRRTGSNGSDFERRSASSLNSRKSEKRSSNSNQVELDYEQAAGEEVTNYSRFGFEDGDSNRRRSMGELSNASSGGDVGLEDRALLNECIYSAMPSSARKGVKSSRSSQKKHSLDRTSTDGNVDESDQTDSARRRLSYPSGGGTSSQMGNREKQTSVG